MIWSFQTATQEKKIGKKNYKVFGVLPKWSQCAMNRAECAMRRAVEGKALGICFQPSSEPFSAICEESSQGWGINHTTGPEMLSVLSESEAHITLMTIQKSREFQ